MLIDIRKFIQEEKEYWDELDELLSLVERYPDRRLELEKIKRLHYLYQRTSADLARITTFASEPATRFYLESLVSRAYGEIHDNRDKGQRFKPLHWAFTTFPRTFRRHIGFFLLSVAIMSVGSVFGGLSVAFDSDARGVLMPFSHLQVDPSERVRQEETVEEDRLAGKKTRFSSYLMTHNTKVSILAMALGMTWGIGTVILLFSNGVMLGGVMIDYILAGESTFLVGWLLPHGSFEIPAILIAGQAGLLLAGGLIGLGSVRGKPMGIRLRMISADLVTLIGGVGVMLVWAGIVEAFFSQYHEPVLPYVLKISFGVVQLLVLVVFLSKSGTAGFSGKRFFSFVKRGPGRNTQKTGDRT